MLKGVKESAILNLKTARGQIEGILAMVDDERYCIDISKQILSAQSLLKKANMEILRGHVKTCVVEAVREGNEDEKIEEIFHILEKYGKSGV